MTCILAIDPGLTGALAFFMPVVLDKISVYDMPVVNNQINPQALRDIIADYKPDFAMIEQVGPMPRDGVRQAWRFASAYTAAHTVVALMNIPTTMVASTRWKKAMHVAGGKDGKEACRAMAIKMFPGCASRFARKKDQGRAEAALLAYYGYLTDGKPLI